MFKTPEEVADALIRYVESLDEVPTSDVEVGVGFARYLKDRGTICKDTSLLLKGTYLGWDRIEELRAAQDAKNLNLIKLARRIQTITVEHDSAPGPSIAHFKIASDEQAFRSLLAVERLYGQPRAERFLVRCMVSTGLYEDAGDGYVIRRVEAVN